MNTRLTHIAYIEDEEDIRTIAKMSLEIGGYRVDVFASGDEALRQLPAHKPQLMLMDVMMPGRDGPSTLAALRELPELRAVPAIFMTAKAQQAEIAHYKAIGALGVITKPFDPMTLAQQVNAIWQAEQDSII